jgi:penicillin-binding protein 1A
MSPTLRHRRRRRSRPRNKAFLAAMVVGIISLIGGLGVIGWIVSVAASAPPITTLKARDPGLSSAVYAANGQRLGFIQANELRVPVKPEDLPQVLKDATVAIEDERFYRHKGVDYTGVVRAAAKNVASKGQTIQGGSTITMQLVRALYISDEQTIQRKIREAKLAEELENEQSKAWILDTYLNSIPYGTVGGQTALGVGAAARVYFNKKVKDLKLHEAAMLAGLPQAPSSYSPVRAEEAAMRRRNEVLDKMAELGMITAQRAERVKRRKLGIDLGRYFTTRREQFFFDYVKDELIKEFGPRQVKLGGLRVDTTIDVDKQKAARSAIAGRLAGIGPSSAIVTLNNKTGEIEAMASSADYGESKFNLAAQGRRQPGSTFKIMTLMTAVRKGIDPRSTTYVSKPLKFQDPEWGEIETKTYDGSYGGSMTLSSATLRSDNAVYMQLALDVGPKDVAKTARDMGITTKLDGYPAESLGGLTIGVSPLEMAAAYASIANGGYRVRPTAIKRITFPDGRKVRPAAFKPKRKKVFEDWMTSTVTDILEQNVQAGTGTSAQIQCPAAGKTGTTDNHSDAWFVGFTPKLTSAVWVGYPKAQIYMRTEYYGGSVAGGTFPAEIWGDYMGAVVGDDCGTFPVPQTTPQWVPFNGRYANSAPPGPEAPYGATTDSYTGGTTTYVPPATAAPATPEPAAPTTPEPAAPAPDTGTGGSTDGGFDPNLYESPPQAAPDTGGGGTAAPDGA